jgi:hypothetical protein
MKKIRYLFTALALVMMSPSSSYATNSLLNIKFAPYTSPTFVYTGAAVIGNSTDYWNNIIPDDNSAATGVALTQAFPPTPSAKTYTFTSQSLGTIGKTSTGFYGKTEETLMRTYVYSSATGIESDFMTISGLDKNWNYDVYVLTQGTKTDKGQQLKLTVGGTDFVQGGVTDGTLSSFQAEQNFMLRTFKTDASGNLKITYASNNGGVAMINGLQIATSLNNPTPTPEPASMLLIGVGGAMMSAMKLRKKKAAENLVA